jgi:hypothetical protein
MSRTQLLGTGCYECHKQGKNYEACHDTCPTYIKAKEEHIERQKQIKDAKHKDRVFYDYQASRIEKYNKNKKGKAYPIRQK